MNNYTNDMWNLHDFCKGMLHMYLHWASKETYHFRVTLNKIQSIKMTRNSAQITYGTPYQAQPQTQTFAWVKKESTRTKTNVAVT